METTFSGSDLMSVDEKGRVGIPARFMPLLRALSPDDPETIGVMLSPDRSIKLLPAPLFRKEREWWKTLNPMNEDERLVLNLSTSNAELMPLDKQNRFRMRPLMKKLCGIKDEVVIQGTGLYMQLYSAEAWLEFHEEGLAKWSGALDRIANRGNAPTPVQYVINALPGAPGGEAPRR